MEEGVPAVALHQSHGAGVGIGQDRLAAMLRDQLFPAGADAFDRLLPADGGKFAGPLGTAPQQRRRQAAGRVDGVLVMQHLGAEQAACDRVVRVAGHTHRVAIIDLDQQAAGVGTVIGADGSMYGHGILMF